jgi:16S rRNA A1518/A1519 N6-dimethyltransferase RsmA/KsgA/DIM1 with predicted DNA glycosylase/AP lyase activity
MNAPQKTKVEFGDFQTPPSLAEKCIERINDRIYKTATLIEPTCGKGNFLKAAVRLGFDRYIGWEINDDYVVQAKSLLKNEPVSIEKKDFFSIDWNTNFDYKFQITFVGNPPWVTNAVLGQINGGNLPEKSNFQKHNGFDAISGKSNFDISEWMLIKILDFISGKKASMAFLIKTSVARKLFIHAQQNQLAVSEFDIYEIDAKKHFDVSVDACFFVVSGFKAPPKKYKCNIYNSLDCKYPRKTMGFSSGKLVADLKTYEALETIDCGSEIQWRSGVKHDCSKVMEFRDSVDGLKNGFGNFLNLPNDYIFPMYKSSAIAKEVLPTPSTFMLVTQRRVGEETESIKSNSIETWNYLNQYKDKLGARRSTIYKKAPQFAIFGVGEYTFKPWKVAISGLYKNRRFQLVGQYQGKPIVLDDTCYSLGFNTEQEALFVLELLTSELAEKFIESIVFEDNKRPITAGLLNRISLFNLAVLTERENEFRSIFPDLLERI